MTDLFLSYLIFWQESMLVHPVFWGIVWTWVGACTGSFLNVCIWRIPRGISIVSPPSHCPKCGKQIPFYENIPVFSFLFLRGKCSSCGKPVSFRYPVVELLTALVFAALFLRFFPSAPPAGEAIPLLLLSFFVAGTLITCAFTDCDFRIVPDCLVLTLLCAELAAGTVPALLAPPGSGVWKRAILLPGLEILFSGLFFSGFAMLGRIVFRREAFGWGDVKLISVLAGYLHLYGLFAALLAASILALAFAPIYRKIKPKMRKRAIPFVPFIALGCALWVFTGKFLIKLFLS